MAEKILLVEDEEKLARMVELELQYEGYQVDKAFDGRTGLDRALSGEYDLVLLDIMLPALSGMEVLRRLRKEGVQLPVIMLTARDSVMDKVAGLDSGADDYITKPFAIEELLALMGAPVSAMTVMQAKIEKDWRNDANRKTNCDTANVTKAVDAAQEQLAALRTLEAQGRLDTLPEKLLQTALLRREHPEATLSELAELHEPPTSKSTVNHRMRKLLALAAEGTETTEEGPA